MRRLPCLVVVLCLVGTATAHARTSVVEVPVTGPLTAATLERMGFDVAGAPGGTHVHVVLHDDAERERLAAAGFAAREVVADVEARDRALRAAEARRAATGPRSALPSGRETYRTLAEYDADLAALVAGHPGLVRRVDAGTSVQGRPIHGVEIARNVNRADDGRPVYVVIGLHHAREWPSGEVSIEFARDLAAGYGTDPRITGLLDRLRVIVLPVTNPDGFAHSRASGGDPLQRKNCAGGCAAGVDLNRNHGAYWGGNGAATSPSHETYRGPGPWSEPEARAIHELSRRRHVTNIQSIHNLGGLVLRPPGFKALGLAPDEARLKALGDRMAAAAGYTSAYGYQLYEVTGAAEDWNYVAQNAFAYTIELDGGCCTDFHGDYRTHVIEQYLGPDEHPGGGDGVREALLLAAEQAADPRDHAVLEGPAPAGATLRLTRSFATATSPVCAFESPDDAVDCTPTAGPPRMLSDWLATELEVPASGRFEWHVAPSTRPFERKAGRTEAWTLQCVSSDGRVLAERKVVVGIGRRRAVDACVPEPGGGTGPGATRPAGPGDGAGGGDARRLGLVTVVPRRQRWTTVLRRGVLVRAACTRTCRLGTRVQRSAARRRASRRGRAAGRVGVLLGRRTLRLSAGRRLTFRVPLSRRARRHVRRRGLRRLVLRLEARTAGQRRLAARGVRLVTR